MAHTARTRLAPWLMLALLAGPGCQSSPNSPDVDRCLPSTGMTTDQLALCGCVAADARAGYRLSTPRSRTNDDTQNVTIVNYICPLGSAGIGKVVVVNGIAKEVFY